MIFFYPDLDFGVCDVCLYFTNKYKHILGSCRNEVSFLVFGLNKCVCIY